MVLPARPEVGKERYLSISKGINGKLRKKPEDFNVEEINSTNKKSHWIWMKENENGKHSVVKLTAKNWDTHVLVRELSRKLGIGQEKVILYAPTHEQDGDGDKQLFPWDSDATFQKILETKIRNLSLLDMK